MTCNLQTNALRCRSFTTRQIINGSLISTFSKLHVSKFILHMLKTLILVLVFVFENKSIFFNSKTIYVPCKCTKKLNFSQLDQENLPDSKNVTTKLKKLVFMQNMLRM